jgi:hypothetical protein
VKKIVNEEKKAWEKEHKADNKRKNEEVNAGEEKFFDAVKKEFPSDCDCSVGSTKDIDRALEEVDFFGWNGQGKDRHLKVRPGAPHLSEQNTFGTKL